MIVPVLSVQRTSILAASSKAERRVISAPRRARSSEPKVVASVKAAGSAISTESSRIISMTMHFEFVGKEEVSVTLVVSAGKLQAVIIVRKGFVKLTNTILFPKVAYT